jgi:queuosine precursor transporter
LIAVIAYLAAIAVANLLAVTYGPSVTVITAFVLIGFDFTCRDWLQARWEGRTLWLRMLALIAAGGAISWLVNRDAAPIAVASTVSFVVAGSIDAVVFALIGRRVHRLYRWNGTNLVGAGVDSLLFPTLAFGALIPAVVIGQYAAKVAGGLLWSLLIVGGMRALPVRRGA